MNTDFIKTLVRRPIFWLAFLYVILMSWSGIHRLNLPDEKIPENKKSVFLNAFNGEKKLARKIRVTYKEFNADDTSDRLPVILIHGSPGDAENFDGFAKLVKNRRLIAVDLPGFGNSEKDIPDYSIYAHSKYIVELLDKLKIKQAHFVGFSLGSGVVLHIADNSPDRVESVSMVAGIGVQEYEIFGNYYLNHFVHGVQLVFFWALKELTPNFGIFNGFVMPYARNFYDSDQRPLRKIMQRIEKPLQILHGKDDPLVPVEAAREHARLVPQSEYIEMDDNHFFVFMRPKKMVEPLVDFWKRVESGDAKTRINSEPERILESQKPFKEKIIKAVGPTAFVFFLLFLVIAFINEDLAFWLGGFFAAQGRFGLVFAIIACIFGSYLSVFLSILIGRKFGKRFPAVSELKDNFRDTIFGRKFMGFQFVDYFHTGRTRKFFWRNLFSFLLASTLWTIVLTTATYFLVLGLMRIPLFDVTDTYLGLAFIAFAFLFFNSYRFFYRKTYNNK